MFYKKSVNSTCEKENTVGKAENMLSWKAKAKT